MRPEGSDATRGGSSEFVLPRRLVYWFTWLVESI